ncbi:hypothetical protein J4440_03650 [Candidatus Woesearchaeota archaeon]|nr:hypothetical protein [Candidatus Woesearchaeota archaeon]
MSEDNLITYENIYEILRMEKYKKDLYKLDKDFFDKVTRYLNEKKTILQGYESKESVFASQSIIKLKKQLDNIYLILNELYEKREAKIMQMALFNSRTNSQLQDEDILLDEEKKVYYSIINLLNISRDSILKNILEGKKPEVKIEEKIDAKPKTNLKLVRFLEPVPKFMGEDMTVFGPFNTEDIGNLPEKIATILIKGNKAEEI